MHDYSRANPIIDNARSDDIAAITRIYGEAVVNGAASFELLPPDEDEMRRRFDNLVNNSYPYLVARLDDGVAGYAYAGPFRPRPAYNWSVENSVYVDPAHQNLGIGALLLDQLIKKCTEKNFRQMIAIIGDSANTSSIRLHEKAGFIHTGTLVGVGRKHQTWLDTVMMQKELGSGRSKPPE